MLADALAATVEYLRSAPEVSALAGTRVFGMELPETEASAMPRHAVVLTPSGGDASGSLGYTPLFRLRLDARCYGPTSYEAMRLWRAVRDALVPRDRRPGYAASGVIVLDVVAESGPIAAREPQVEWPVVIGVYLCLVHEGTA